MLSVRFFQIEIHVIQRRKVFNFGEVLVERLPGGQKLQHRGTFNWFHDQTIALHLQAPRNRAALDPVKPSPPAPIGANSVFPKCAVAEISSR